MSVLFAIFVIVLSYGIGYLKGMGKISPKLCLADSKVKELERGNEAFRENAYQAELKFRIQRQLSLDVQSRFVALMGQTAGLQAENRILVDRLRQQKGPFVRSLKRSGTMGSEGT